MLATRLLAPCWCRAGATATANAIERKYPEYPFLQLEVEAPEGPHHKETKHHKDAAEEHEGVSICQGGALICELATALWIVSAEVRAGVIDALATHPAPLLFASRARHVVATADLVSKDTASRARFGLRVQRKSEMLIFIHLLPVSLTRLTSMCIGMVEAKFRSTLMALHFQNDATLFVSFGLAEGLAAGALP